jgi:hypothetical protein
MQAALDQELFAFVILFDSSTQQAVSSLQCDGEQRRNQRPSQPENVFFFVSSLLRFFAFNRGCVQSTVNAAD